MPVYYVDGSVVPSPGGIVGYGWTCPKTNESGNGIAYQGGESATNNASEWLAAAAALAHVLCVHKTTGTVTIRSDSELLVNQLNGEWRVKHGNLKPLAAVVNIMIEELQGIGIDVIAEWVPREQNKVADELSHRTIKQQLKERRQMTQRETTDG